jgi:hypothetical protein
MSAEGDVKDGICILSLGVSSFVDLRPSALLIDILVQTAAGPEYIRSF